MIVALNYILFSVLMILHPLHITITNIDYSDNDDNFNISIKIFRTDLELALAKEFNHKFDLLNKSNQLSDSIINDYLNKNLVFYINQKKQRLNFSSNKIDTEAVWLYYSVENIELAKTMKLENKLLTELYPDQKNLVITNIKGKNNGFTLSKDDWEFSVELN